jgi:hypothetical protein
MNLYHESSLVEHRQIVRLPLPSAHVDGYEHYCNINGALSYINTSTFEITETEYLPLKWRIENNLIQIRIGEKIGYVSPFGKFLMTLDHSLYKYHNKPIWSSSVYGMYYYRDTTALKILGNGLFDTLGNQWILDRKSMIISRYFKIGPPPETQGSTQVLHTAYQNMPNIIPTNKGTFGVFIWNEVIAPPLYDSIIEFKEIKNKLLTFNQLC